MKLERQSGSGERERVREGFKKKATTTIKQ
jgi:hypothetical protein